MITLDYLKFRLKYDENTGSFTWSNPKGRVRRGKRAGTITHSGYIKISIDTIQYFEHDLVWYITYRVYPKFQLDHKNRIKTDNRIDNLRPADNSQNKFNIQGSTRSASGIRGVTFDYRRHKWLARISAYGKHVHLGYFDSKELAIKARQDAVLKYHGEFGVIEANLEEFGE